MRKFYILFLSIFIAHLLPAQQTVGLFEYDPLTYEGYTLFAPKNGAITYLIDNCGKIINTWEGDGTTPGETVYLLENGNLLRTGKIDSNFNGAGTGGRISIFDWEGNLIWSYEHAGLNFHHHHDVALLPNGNILLIVWERYNNDEATLLGRNPALAIGDVWSEAVIEIKPIGTDEAEIVWEWHLWEHLIQDFDSTKMNFGVVADHPELLDINFGAANIDWIHFNAIDYNPTLDQILLCSRHLNEVYIIDHSTTTAEAASHEGGNSGKGGDILYRWGNPQVYDRGTDVDRKLFGPHDANWIDENLPDENKIIIFNNGFQLPGDDYSTVDVIDPPLENNAYSILDGQPFGPDELFWNYQGDPLEDLFSSTMSGAQRLPNGNTLITEGRRGNFYEVTYDGEIVWHYRIPVGLNGPVSQGDFLTNPNIFRSTKYGLDYPAFIGKDLTPGDPVELNPFPSDCETFTSITSVEDFESLENQLEIWNNLSREYIVIKNKTSKEIGVEIFDLMGREIGNTIFSIDEEFQLSTSDWENGFYFLRVYIVGKDDFFIRKIVKSN